MNFIRSHTNENISVSDVADHINRSDSYTMKHFKEELGINMGAYIIRCKLEEAKAANAAANAVVDPQKDTIAFDDFQKMDIRVSRIVAAEKVAKTKKLLKLTVDTGVDTRVIVSGIAEYYKPEELVGRQVLVLVNLAPRELKGIESKGMILMGADPTGKLVLLQPDNEVVNGSVVG